MAHPPQRRESPQPSAGTTLSVAEPHETSAKSELPPSPTRSDKSSESEGRPVREKLKETRIDAQSSSDLVPNSDLHMSDAPNGSDTATVPRADQSTSGSESERGRLRRKRSREAFEDDQEAEKHPEKKQERHARKKSRDVTSPKDVDFDSLPTTANTTFPRIEENDGDESMLSVDEPAQAQKSTSKKRATPEAGASNKKKAGAVISPKNKRTRDEAEGGDKSDLEGTDELLKETAAVVKTEEERTPKRPRDKSDSQPGADESKTKIPPSSGFANTSVASPFSALSPPPQTANPNSNAAEKLTSDVPQTSSDKFKSSGFSTFSSSNASPFGSVASSGSKSPFAAATSGNKITSFAATTSTPTSSGGGFAALGSSSSTSAFGGGSVAPVGVKSVFGGALANSTFGGLGAPKSGLPSFATPGHTTITGLSQKPPRTFGAKGDRSDPEDESEGDDQTSDNDDSDKNKGGNSEPSTWKHQPVETGEEGETTKWTGRAKLYTMGGESGNRQWQERGAGPFKLNITRETPKKARFVLRADGTHRLLLNAAVTKNLVFGDPKGDSPTDGRLFFNTPTPDGEIEMHILRLKPERATELHKAVKDLKEKEL